jgi:hypothetical protein
VGREAIVTDDVDYLETEYVFVDTEAYVREKFDWKSKTFSRLEDLAKKRQIRLLTTSITNREVQRKINEALIFAQSALKKHEVLLEQLAIPIKNASGDAEERVLNQFEEFLKRVKASEVPLTNNLEKLFSDYFEHLPPFSEGKKAEFPDAAVIDALRAFASQKNKRIYLVSGDNDLKNCCTQGGALIHAASLNEIISRATVTRKLHDDLLSFATHNHWLKSDVKDQLKQANVHFYGLGRFSEEIEIEGAIDDVDDFSISALNVISREPDGMLTCEMEFEVSVALSLQFSVGRHSYEEVDVAGASNSAEVIFQIDNAAADKFAYLSVETPREIEVYAADLDALRQFR